MGTFGGAVPHDWRVVADKVNASDTGPGKVLQLPLQPFYMVTTTWGFTGADLVPRQLVKRPVLQRMPGGYFDAPPALRAALYRLEPGPGPGPGAPGTRPLSGDPVTFST